MEPKETYDITLKTPFLGQIVGPSQTGKSSILKKFLKYANDICYPPFEKICYQYGCYEDDFKDYPYVDFVQNYDPYYFSKDYTEGKSVLLILDDVTDSIDNSIALLYSREAHHNNVSVWCSFQNLYNRDLKWLRTVSLNTQYLIVTKAIRDKHNLRSLQISMFPGLSKYFFSSFEDATSHCWKYVLYDLHPSTPSFLRVRTGLFPDEIEKCAYLNKEK